MFAVDFLEMLGVGFEPTSANTAGLKSAPLDQLGHPSKTFSLKIDKKFNLYLCCCLENINIFNTVPAGFEPATPRLTVVCSNQLSYGTSLGALYLSN